MSEQIECYHQKKIKLSKGFDSEYIPRNLEKAIDTQINIKRNLIKTIEW